jgi:hypothetical protein
VVYQGCHQRGPAPGLVGRLVALDQPDRSWVSDLTDLPPDEGWL